MARRNRRYAVPGAAQGMQTFKADVMKSEGYAVDPSHPDNVKYEVAKGWVFLCSKATMAV